MAKLVFLLCLISAICCGQLFPMYPVSAHVTLYFPHLADGGNLAQQWQTSFIFVNPHPTLTARVRVRLYGDNGIALNLDLGSGSSSEHVFSIPPGGTVIKSSTMASSAIVTGHAIATSNVPLQGTILFRELINTEPILEVAASATLPSPRYLSPATAGLGVALANNTGVSTFYQVAVLDSSGGSLGSTMIGVPGLGHISFNLSQQFAGLASDFRGSIVITPQNSGDQVLAWTLNVDRGLIATLPPGALEWPVSHRDRITLVFRRLLAAAPSLLSGLGSNLGPDTAPILDLSEQQVVNTFAASETVRVNLALSELISDSPSELAFLVAHELAHTAQNRSAKPTILLPNDPANREPDADLIAMILVLSAGFDPYGAAGALGKLNMASGTTGLLSPNFDNLPDGVAASAFGARINAMPGVIAQACDYPALAGFCAPYKAFTHPHFPGPPRL